MSSSSDSELFLSPEAKDKEFKSRCAISKEPRENYPRRVKSTFSEMGKKDTPNKTPPTSQQDKAPSQPPQMPMIPSEVVPASAGMSKEVSNNIFEEILLKANQKPQQKASATPAIVKPNNPSAEQATKHQKESEAYQIMAAQLQNDLDESQLEIQRLKKALDSVHTKTSEKSAVPSVLQQNENKTDSNPFDADAERERILREELQLVQQRRLISRSTTPAIDQLSRQFEELNQSSSNSNESHQPPPKQFTFHPSVVNIRTVVGVLGNDSKDFSRWLHKLKSFLELTKAWIDPKQNFHQLSAYDQSVARAARQAMNFCVDDSSFEEIRHHENSIDAINALITLHDAKTATHRIEAQHRLSNMIFKEGDCIVTYISNMRRAYTDLDRYGSPSTDKQQADQLIASLPRSMNGLRSIISAWPPEIYNFDRVADAVRNAVESDKLTQKLEPKSVQDTGYVTREFRQDSRQRYRDNDRNYRESFNRSISRDRDRSRRRESNNDSDHPKLRQATSRSPSSNRQRYRSRDRSNSSRKNDYNSKSQAQNVTLADDVQSTAAYFEHGGYSATTVDSSQMKLTPRQIKLREKRQLRHTQPPIDHEQRNKKPKVSPFKHPFPFARKRPSPTSKSLPFSTYRHWQQRPSNNFNDVSRNELVSSTDKRELISSDNIICSESPKRTCILVPTDKSKIDRRHVSFFPRLTVTTQVPARERLGPPKPEASLMSPKALFARKSVMKRLGPPFSPVAKKHKASTARSMTEEFTSRQNADAEAPDDVSNSSINETLTPTVHGNAEMFAKLFELINASEILDTITAHDDVDIDCLEQQEVNLKSGFNDQFKLHQSAYTGFGTIDECTVTLNSASGFQQLDHQSATPPESSNPSVPPPVQPFQSEISISDELLEQYIDAAQELSTTEFDEEIKKIEFYPTAFHSTGSNKASTNWIIDSGASVHMTHDASLFHDIEYGFFGHVVIANGTRLKREGRGTIILVLNHENEPITLRLENAAFIPQLTSSLISVRALNKSSVGTNSSTVTFDNDKVCIEIKNRKVVLGTWNENVYVLNEMLHRASPCVHEWHRRICHRNIPDIKKAANRLNIKITQCACSDDCDSCIRAKQPNKPFAHSSTKPESPLDIVVSDLSGPWPKSHSGSVYYMTMVDLATNYTEVWCLHQKSDAAKSIIQYAEKQENLLNKRIKIFRTDRGTEYCNKTLTDYFLNKGITHQLTCPESPQQNGVAERLNRTLGDAIRTQLLAHSLFDSLWSEALHHTVYSLNRLPRDNCEHSPIENFYDKKFNHQFYEFGHPCYVSERKFKLTKLTDRAKMMRFVGIDNVSKGFRVWDGKKVWVERNVRFTSSRGLSQQSYHEITQEDLPAEILSNDRESTTDNPRRSARLKQRNESAMSVLPSGSEPQSYMEAMTCEDSDEWEKAIKTELLNCSKNKIWTKVPKPQDRKIIGCRWVFKIKLDEKGNTKSFKARIVAKGFSQIEGVDYEETFAAVATSASLRLLLTKASKESLVVKQYDVTAAFLNGMLKEEIYMRPPPGFEEGNFVLKLDKSIYGLKQAANVWYNTFSDALHSIGFQKSKSDSCLHIYNRDSQTVFVISHVDDTLWVSKSAKLIEKLTMELAKFFEMKDLGEVHHFLGLEIKKDADGCFSMCQSTYIDRIAKTHILEGLKPQTIPINAGFYKLEHKSNLPNNNQYRSLLGSLLFVAVNTRPDIAAAINILAQKTSQPSETDFVELKHVLAYLLNTKLFSLKLYNKECIDVPLTGYSDADWAEDRTNRKSISGILCCVYGAPIIWSSKKQNCVAKSSTEAEYYAAGETIRQLIWLQRLMQDIGMETIIPITLHCDNQSCIKLALKDNTKRSKHFDIAYHHVRDVVKSGAIVMSYIPSEVNPADLLTKPLTKNKIDVMRSLYRLN